MYTFKKFVILKEYITPKQKKTINENGIEMSPEARKNTDHFFGEGNDVKREDIIDYKHDKSEIHRKVENHLNQSLSHEEYTSGITKDKYGRDAKIGRMIKDEQLRNEFASDNTRSGSKSVKKPYMSVVRGVHVMGQTNPEPDDIHPTGHAWSQQSCKNIKDGSNNRYLKHEVKHGTVVVFGHDHDGKEIYRATLQPHANDQKHVAYGVDSEYGIKHPSFTKHAKDVASRLSGEHKGGSLLYKKHPQVYNDSGLKTMVHPNATPEHISKVLNDKDRSVRQTAMRHPNATSEHISKALDDIAPSVRYTAIKHPKATPEHISKALNDRDSGVRYGAIEHPNATPEHISKALDDKDDNVRQKAIEHPKATPEHISKAMNDKDPYVRRSAIQHPNATSEHISKAMNDKNPAVRGLAIQHPKATFNTTPEHISKVLNDEDPGVRRLAIEHPNATPEHISKAMNDKDPGVRRSAIQHPNATPEHISKALNDENYGVRQTAIKHPKATPEHISKALNDEYYGVRWTAISHPKATPEHISKALNDESDLVRSRAIEHPNATSEHKRIYERTK